MKRINLLLGIIFTFAGLLVLLYTLKPKTQKVLPSSTTAPIPTATPTPTPVASLNIYPNSQFTVGDIFSVTKDQVCVKGYTATVRNVSLTTKKLIYQEYGVTYPQNAGDYEVDHFIPLELGGSNDIKNLWLEPASPIPGFHEKDIVENYLHSKVCKGEESLVDAQNEIKSDWYKVYQQIPNAKAYLY